jgi:hypothetical protein
VRGAHRAGTERGSLQRTPPPDHDKGWAHTTGSPPRQLADATARCFARLLFCALALPRCMACLPAGRPCIHHLSQRLAQHSSHRHSSPSWCSSTARRQGGRARNSNRRVAVRVQAPESAVPRSSSNGTPAAAAAAPAAAAAAAATPPPTSWWASQHDASILALALPAALALAADPLLSMVDTALVGRLGGDELVRVSMGVVSRGRTRVAGATAEQRPTAAHRALLCHCCHQPCRRRWASTRAFSHSPLCCSTSWPQPRRRC